MGMHYSEANEDTSVMGWADIDTGRRCTRSSRGGLGAGALRLTFTPHLVPMTRGILATCYATLARACSAEPSMQTYREAYDGEPFMRLAARPLTPSGRWDRISASSIQRWRPRAGGSSS